MAKLLFRSFPDAARALARIIYKKEIPVLKEEIKTHELKCWPEHFTPLLNGLKPFEIRKNDRGFLPADILHIREWNPKTETYTGQAVFASIGHISTFEQKPGFVVMGLKIFRSVTRER